MLERSPVFRSVWRALDTLCAVASPELAYQLALQVIFLRLWPAPDGAGLARCLGPAEPALSRTWTRLGLDRPFDLDMGTTGMSYVRRLYGEGDRALAALVREVDKLNRPVHLFDACLDRYSSRYGTGGDYYTPRPLARLMAGVVAPRPGERVLDPVCGSGRLLIAADQWARRHGGGVGALVLHGRDVRPEARRAAVMNLTLNGLCNDLGDRAVDSLSSGPGNLSVDVVCANPPLNTKDWGYEEASRDPRWVLGLPPKGNANFAWVQHALHQLSPQGRAIILLPESATRRPNTAELHIRRRLVERDLLAGVVALPARLFPHTRTGTTLWLLSKDKSANAHWGETSRVGEVLFVDARRMPSHTDQGGRRFADEDIDRICRVFADWRGLSYAQGDSVTEERGWSRSTSQEEVARHGYDLDPGAYVLSSTASSEKSVPEGRLGHPKDVVYERFEETQRIDQWLRNALEAEAEAWERAGV
ncbi:N-6 DNA methylase [Streptomyces sp. NPDC000229]|uniref:N-6 DNA methylase n=1 Tax=Streptomyces sp. NPDC000229 TaxID=3154247 RepID=UPI00332403CF